MSVIYRRPLAYPASSQWPGPTNTGVPAGTSLTPHSGNFDTTSNGQIVQDLDISGAFVLNHANVIIRRCRITAPTSEVGAFFVAGTASGTYTLEDCELSASNGAGSGGIFYDNNATPPAGTIRRIKVHSCENAIGCLSNFNMRDSFIFNLNPAGADPHTDGLQTSDNVSNVNIIHNTFDMRAPGTGPNNSCLQFDNDSVTNFNWLVENNKFLLSPGSSQGGACVRMPVSDASGNNLRVVNNRMTPGFFGYAIPNPPNTITEWSGNVNDDTGAVIP